MDNKEQSLYDYIIQNNLLSEYEVGIIKSCTNEIRELSPTDVPLLLKKENTMLDLMQKLSWCIYSINRIITTKKTGYRRIKDPEYVLLVRQGRPSSAAIDAEIRFKKPDLYEIEDLIETLDNIKDYLSTLYNSMDKYIFMMRERGKYLRGV